MQRDMRPLHVSCSTFHWHSFLLEAVPPSLPPFALTLSLFSSSSIKYRTVTCALGKEASWLWFVFLLRCAAVQSERLLAATAPHVASGRVSKQRQACPCVRVVGGNRPTGVATRGRGRRRRGRKNSYEERKEGREEVNVSYIQRVFGERWGKVSVRSIKGDLSGRWRCWDCWECRDWEFHRLSSLDAPEFRRRLLCFCFS